MGTRIDLLQGSDEWLQFRSTHFGASEAAAMLGLSTKVSRNELLRMKATGTVKEFSDWVQENILDRGHEIEAMARPIAEEIIGDDLYPMVYADEEMLSASCDGLTFDRAAAWENKQFNAALFKAILDGELPEEFMPQPQQIMMETGAKRTLFTCTDGTRDCWAEIWVEADEAWFDRLRKGWTQFKIDMENYQHVEVIEPARAAPTIALPALSIRVEGSIALQSNLTLFGEKLRHFIDKVDKNPSTDQAFADAEAAFKILKKAEDALEAAEANALAQTASVDEMRRTVAMLKELARSNRLSLEKIVKARKGTIRIEIATEAKTKFAEHIESLNKRLGRTYMPTIAADFAGAMKGLKTITSIRNAVDTEMARAKIEANEIADKMQANLETLRTMADDHKFLFADILQIVMKDNADLVLLIESRIAAHEKAKADEAEALRVKIEAQERAKAEAAAAETLRIEREADETRRRQADAEARAPAESIAASTQAVLGAAQEIRLSEPADAAPAQTSLLTAVAPSPTPVESSAMVNLCMINAALGFTVSAEFLTKLGYPFTQDRNAKLYRESDLRAMYEAIARHVLQIAGRELKSAA